MSMQDAITGALGTWSTCGHCSSRLRASRESRQWPAVDKHTSISSSKPPRNDRFATHCNVPHKAAVMVHRQRCPGCATCYSDSMVHHQLMLTESATLETPELTLHLVASNNTLLHEDVRHDDCWLVPPPAPDHITVHSLRVSTQTIICGRATQPGKFAHGMTASNRSTYCTCCMTDSCCFI